jgi:hypothetical protein
MIGDTTMQILMPSVIATEAGPRPRESLVSLRPDWNVAARGVVAAVAGRRSRAVRRRPETWHLGHLAGSDEMDAGAGGNGLFRRPVLESRSCPSDSDGRSRLVRSLAAGGITRGLPLRQAAHSPCRGGRSLLPATTQTAPPPRWGFLSY